MKEQKIFILVFIHASFRFFHFSQVSNSGGRRSYISGVEKPIE
mgnify:CR=1 FL=1